MSDVPTLASALATFAYHVACLKAERPSRADAPYCERLRFGMGLGWFAASEPGCPSVLVEVEIRPAGGDDAWGPWAQVSFDGRSYGNRSGAIEEYARRAAPYLAWIAAYWAREQARAA